MATVIRNTHPGFSELVTAHNSLKDAMVAKQRLAQADIAAIAEDADVGTTPTFEAIGAHNDRSEVVIGSADASDLATSLALVNEILGVYEFHMADTLAHKVAGVALASYAKVSTLAAAITRANDIKSKYNTHRASTTYHYEADSTNAVSSADATDQASLNTLLTEMKTDINAHLAQGAAEKSLRLVSV